MLKLWDRKNNFVQQESAMFAGTDVVKLLFPAEKIFRVYIPATGEEFFEGKDFEHQPGSDSLKLLPGSRIPYLSPEKMRPAADSPCHPVPGAKAIKGATDGGLLIFDGGSFFAEHQICADYRATHIDFDPELPEQSSKMPKLKQKLAVPGSEIRITLIGDSISEGFNATGFVRCEPFAPPYIDQVARHLADRFRVNISCFNRAVNGTRTDFALQNPQRWVDDHTDLLIIAYGMNEFSRKDADEFLRNNQELISMIRKSSPECEIILLNSMTGNPEWLPTVPGADHQYAEKIRNMVASSDDSIALADVQKVWKKLLERKGFYDLTGNGVNHPNDYGHRVYASVLLQLLCGADFF